MHGVRDLSLGNEVFPMQRTILTIGLLGLCLSGPVSWASDASFMNEMSIESSTVERDIPLSFDQERITFDAHDGSADHLSRPYWSNDSYVEHKLFYLLSNTLMRSNMVNFFPDPMVRLNQYFIDDKKPQCHGLHFQVQSQWQSYYLQLEYRF
jgi:hypothetical protein